MVASATEFRKNGFNDEDSAMLAQVANMYINVADEAISASDSASLIISQMKAFGIEANNAMSIIDAINDVSNNYAVSSADVASALTKTSSAMGVLGNDFNQTIGLVVSGAEILTGQSSKVAKGLRTIGNNLADAANEAGSIEYKVGGATKSLNLFDASGKNLKSTFQILSDLKDDWDNMSNAEQQALGIAYAGKNQFEVFAAVMNNFDTATKAAETALNSAGSAAQENEAYTESLDFKVNTLKATFEDFSNRVLNSELVGGFIDAGTALLKFANSDAGVAITQVALLTAGIVGVVGVIGKVVGAISLVVAAYKAGSAVMGASGFIALLTSGKLALILGAVGLAIAGVAGAIAYFRGKEAESEKTAQEWNAKLAETKTKLEENEKRLAEINQMPWQERTSEILDEKEALEAENAELKKNTKELEDNAKAAAKRTALEGFEIEHTQIDPYTGKKLEYTTVLQGADAIKYLTKSLDEYSTILEENGRIEDDQRKEFDRVTEAAIKKRDAIRFLIASGYDLDEMFGKDVADVLRQFVNDVDAAVDTCDKYGIHIDTTTDALDKNTDAENANADAKSASVEVSKTGSEEAYNQAKSLLEEATAVDTNTAAYRALVAQEIIFNKTTLDVGAKIKALQVYAIASGAAKQAVDDLIASTSQGITKYKDEFGVSYDIVDGAISAKPKQIKKYADEFGISYDEAAQRLNKKVVQKTSNNLTDLWKQLEALIAESDSGTKSRRSISRSSTSTKTSTSKVKENIHAEADAIYETIQEANAVYEYHKKQQLAALEAEKQAIQNNLDAAKATMDQYQAELDAISASQEAQVAAVKAQLEEQLAIIEAQQNVLQKQMDDINDEIDSINAVIDYAQEYADRQIEALENEKAAIQETIDAINAKYDAQLEDLDKTNDALDEQIKREKLLKALHEAQAKKKLVYQNGRFVYAQDIAAISKAQEALDEFDREKQVEKEKAAIEEARKNELEYSKNQQKALEDEIKRWQDYKKGWASLVSDYQYNQNALIAAEKYGVNLEKQNWDQRLGNLNKFNDAYTDIMAEQARVQDEQTKLQEQATRLQEAAAAEQERIVERMQKQYDNMAKILDMARQAYEANQDLMDDVDKRIDDVNKGDGYDDISQSELRDLLETDWAKKALRAKSIEELQYYLSQRQRKADYKGVVLGSSPTYPSQEDIWYKVAPKLGDDGAPWGIPGYRSSKPSSGSSGGYTPPTRDEPGQLYAAGTTHASGGMALVGENGPELRVLNNGDGILPADITRNLWGWGSLDPTSAFGKLAHTVTSGLTFNNANLSFPNVRSGADAKDFVTNLKNLAYQYAFAR